jgi:hypothetical protein
MRRPWPTGRGGEAVAPKTTPLPNFILLDFFLIIDMIYLTAIG